MSVEAWLGTRWADIGIHRHGAAEVVLQIREERVEIRMCLEAFDDDRVAVTVTFKDLSS